MKECKYIEKKIIIDDLESSSDDSDKEYMFLPFFLSLTRKYNEKVQIV